MAPVTPEERWRRTIDLRKRPARSKVTGLLREFGFTERTHEAEKDIESRLARVGLLVEPALSIAADEAVVLISRREAPRVVSNRSGPEGGAAASIFDADDREVGPPRVASEGYAVEAPPEAASSSMTAASVTGLEHQLADVRTEADQLRRQLEAQMLEAGRFEALAREQLAAHAAALEDRKQRLIEMSGALRATKQALEEARDEIRQAVAELAQDSNVSTEVRDRPAAPPVAPWTAADESSLPAPLDGVPSEGSGEDLDMGAGRPLEGAEQDKPVKDEFDQWLVPADSRPQASDEQGFDVRALDSGADDDLLISDDAVNDSDALHDALELDHAGELHDAGEVHDGRELHDGRGSRDADESHDADELFAVGELFGVAEPYEAGQQPDRDAPPDGDVRFDLDLPSERPQPLENEFAAPWPDHAAEATPMLQPASPSPGAPDPPEVAHVAERPTLGGLLRGRGRWHGSCSICDRVPTENKRKDLEAAGWDLDEAAPMCPQCRGIG